jgi:glutamate carboxypeptidase
VGTVEGGVVINRVPHHAQARGEMRTFDPEVYDRAIADLLALADEPTITSADGFPCAITIAIQDKTAPWPQNPATESLFSIWEQAAGGLGYTLIREARGGLSDGNHTWDTLPTIDGLGPSGANGHCSERSEDGSKDQEYVSMPSFAPKAVLNYFAIKNLINSL